jgi:myosin heavy subunit
LLFGTLHRSCVHCCILTQLIERKGNGLLSFLNEQSAVPAGSDATFLDVSQLQPIIAIRL